MGEMGVGRSGGDWKIRPEGGVRRAVTNSCHSSTIHPPNMGTSPTKTCPGYKGIKAVLSASQPPLSTPRTTGADRQQAPAIHHKAHNTTFSRSFTALFIILTPTNPALRKPLTPDFSSSALY
ncbi:hypothetical protein ACOMHN_031578 [Nucella lapillus]